MVKTLASRIMPALAAALLFITTAAAAEDDQILASVGDKTVTASDLESAVISSPLGAQFPSLSADDQAAARGILLQRLVASRLLQLEAESQGLGERPDFKDDLEAQRQGFLYRAYMDRLRERIKIPEDSLAKLKETYKNDPLAIEPAKSKELSDLYTLRRGILLRDLKEKAGVVLHEDRIKEGAGPDTVLAEAKDFEVRLKDLGTGVADGKHIEAAHELLVDRIELLLVANQAERDGLDVSERIETYRNERLPALLLQKKVKEWIPDEKTVRAYFDANPGIGAVAERRRIGQIVLETRDEAEAMRKRIQDGESLFTLAGEHSIDPYGRKNNGDMGWMKAGSGMPAIEKAMADLPDETVSEVIETPKGFHLVMIIDRRPGKNMAFEEITDKVRQALFDEKLAAFVTELAERYPVKWALPMEQDDKGTRAE